MPSTSPKLWIVAIPLGNHGDLSPRARTVLENVDFVLAEDTRRAGLFCQRCQVRVTRFMSLHDHNEEKRCQEIIHMLEEGMTAALISDAGTPLMADPGYRLVRACRQAGLAVSMVPGPCAPIAALMAAGIAPQPFTFFGFLPRDAAAQEELFLPFITVPSTLVFFERKDRLHNTLRLAHTLLGARDMVIARELTKTHEEFICTTLDAWENVPIDIKGEITVVLGPPLGNIRTTQEDVLAILATEIAQNNNSKGRDTARRVQHKVTGWTTKEIYLLSTKLPR